MFAGLLVVGVHAGLQYLGPSNDRPERLHPVRHLTTHGRLVRLHTHCPCLGICY